MKLKQDWEFDFAWTKKDESFKSKIYDTKIDQMFLVSEKN